MAHINPCDVQPNPEAMRVALNEELRRLFGVDQEHVDALRAGTFPPSLRTKIVRRAWLTTIFASVIATVLGLASLRTVVVAWERAPGQLVAAALFMLGAGLLGFVARKSYRLAINPEIEQVEGTGYATSKRKTESRSSTRSTYEYWLAVGGRRVGITERQFNALENGMRYRMWCLKSLPQVVAIEALGL